MYYVWCYCAHLTFLLKFAALMFKILYTFRPASVVINIVYIIYIYVMHVCIMTWRWRFHFRALFTARRISGLSRSLYTTIIHTHIYIWTVATLMYIQPGVFSGTIIPSGRLPVRSFAPRKSFLYIIICLPHRLFVEIFRLFTVTAADHTIDHVCSQLETKLFWSFVWIKHT